MQIFIYLSKFYSCCFAFIRQDTFDLVNSVWNEIWDAVSLSWNIKEIWLFQSSQHNIMQQFKQQFLRNLLEVSNKSENFFRKRHGNSRKYFSYYHGLLIIFILRSIHNKKYIKRVRSYKKSFFSLARNARNPDLISGRGNTFRN